MADLNRTNFIIRAKRGVVADLNTTEHKSVSFLGELAYTTDTKELYIFDGTEYVLAVDLSGLVPYTGATGTVNLGLEELRFSDGTNYGAIRDTGSAFQIVARTDTAKIGVLNAITNYVADLDFSAIDSSDKTVSFQNATGTVALTSDITIATAESNSGITPAADGTYANPTSITIVNGIITAIS